MSASRASRSARVTILGGGSAGDAVEDGGDDRGQLGVGDHRMTDQEIERGIGVELVGQHHHPLDLLDRRPMNQGRLQRDGGVRAGCRR